jgi:hypothetical protein
MRNPSQKKYLGGVNALVPLSDIRLTRGVLHGLAAGKKRPTKLEGNASKPSFIHSFIPIPPSPPFNPTPKNIKKYKSETLHWLDKFLGTVLYTDAGRCNREK